MGEGSGNCGGTAAELRDHYRERIHGVIHALWDIEVPIVGAINGPAIGLDNDVATLCDIRIAAASARRFSSWACCRGPSVGRARRNGSSPAS